METLYDVIIVGGGPAGLTAALYLARAKFRVLVLEKEQFGGQIAITHEVENYPGIEKISGKELTETIRRQAERFGAEFQLAEAAAFDLSGDIKTVHTGRGDYQCYGILLATGAHPRPGEFRGEETHKGRGVAYCATCDGEFFTGKEVFVIGGGYAAAEESVFLTRFARHVTVLVRKQDFSCAVSVAEQTKNNPKITVHTNTVMEEVSGEHGLTYARYKNTVTGEVTEYKSEETFGVFVFAGYAPATETVRGIVELDSQGYIITDKAQKTSAEGVYAAGDVCIKPLRQVVTATADGALAATELEKYVSEMHRKTGVIPQITVHQVNTVSTSASGDHASDDHDLFTPEMRRQLDTVFSRMEQKILLKLYTDDRPVSEEVKNFLSAFTALSDKVQWKPCNEQGKADFTPRIEVWREDGTSSGLAFHGMPTGHEFTSFVLGIYNAAGPGQTLDSDTKRRIEAISKPTDIKVLVTLSCTMCPDLVVATQRIAAENPNVTAYIYDLQHFEELKKQFNVMSVPCMIINDQKIFFGKKNIHQILDLLGQG